jgi:tight adherence protein B
MIEIGLAALAFLFVMLLVSGVWWAVAGPRRVTERLDPAAPAGGALEDVGILRGEVSQVPSRWLGSIGNVLRHEWLESLIQQAGYRIAVADFLLLVLACAGGAGLLGWLRTGVLLAVPAIISGAAAPFLFMVYKRTVRLNQFEKTFPDALDAMARAIRAGNALSAAIQLVAEESPDPIGPEFRRVVDEIRLGLNPAEALFKLVERVPTEDIRFFCAAVRIQRGSGGNLAELLDRLSEVIRERYRILSHARVLSAQHKWSAICVGLSPLAFALAIHLLNPGYFEPLLTSPLGVPLIVAGLVLEAIGFFSIWRIAQIKV